MYKIRIYTFAILSLLFILGMLTSVTVFVTYKIKVDEFMDQIVIKRCNVTECTDVPTTEVKRYNMTFTYHSYSSTEVWYPPNTTKPDGCPSTILCYYDRDHDQHLLLYKNYSSSLILSLSIIQPPDSYIFVYHLSIIGIPVGGISSVLCIIMICITNKKLEDEFMRY